MNILSRLSRETSGDEQCEKPRAETKKQRHRDCHQHKIGDVIHVLCSLDGSAEPIPNWQQACNNS
jgi:hypothetical protein